MLAGPDEGLSGMGLFSEDSSGRFSLTPLGEALRSGGPGSVRSPVLIFAGLAAKAVAQLSYSVKTGKPGFEEAYGMPLFEWLAKHPVEASMFSEESGLPVLHISVRDHSLRLFRRSSWEQVSNGEGPTQEEVRNVIAGVLFARDEVNA